jgi:hypothetical protein
LSLFFFLLKPASKAQQVAENSRGGELSASRRALLQRLLRQYLYFCTSKASKLSTLQMSGDES